MDSTVDTVLSEPPKSIAQIIAEALANGADAEEVSDENDPNSIEHEILNREHTDPAEIHINAPTAMSLLGGPGPVVSDSEPEVVEASVQPEETPSFGKQVEDMSPEKNLEEPDTAPEVPTDKANGVQEDVAAVQDETSQCLAQQSVEIEPEANPETPEQPAEAVPEEAEVNPLPAEILPVEPEVNPPTEEPATPAEQPDVELPGQSVEQKDLEEVAAAPVEALDLDTVYYETVHYLKDIENQTRIHIRKIIRRVNKLKNYSKTNEDVAAQKTLLQNRCDRGVVKLSKLEDARAKTIRAVERLTTERDDVTKEIYSNPMQHDVNVLKDVCIRLNKKRASLEITEPEIKFLKEQIDEMWNILTDFEEEQTRTDLSSAEIAHDINVFYEALKTTANISKFQEQFDSLDEKLNDLYDARNLTKLESMRRILSTIKEEDEEPPAEQPETYSLNN